MKRFFIFLTLLSSSITFAQNWNTDFAQAKREALQYDKTIILVFQGSDWCGPCMKLDEEIWSTDIFKIYSAEHFVMLKADFPKKKNNALEKEQQIHNNKLAETYNKNGYFPFVVILDATGKVLGETGYKKISPENYIEILESFKN